MASPALSLMFLPQALFGSMPFGLPAAVAHWVPADWLIDILRGADDSAEVFAAGDFADMLPGGHYRNQWWVPKGGQVFLALGIHGQLLFVDRGSQVVIGVLSTWPMAVD